MYSLVSDMVGRLDVSKNLAGAQKVAVVLQRYAHETVLLADGCTGIFMGVQHSYLLSLKYLFSLLLNSTGYYVSNLGYLIVYRQLKTWATICILSARSSPFFL